MVVKKESGLVRLKLAFKSLVMAVLGIACTVVVAWTYKEDFYTFQNKFESGGLILPEDFMKIQFLVPSITLIVAIYYFLKSLWLLIRPSTSQ